MTTSQAIETIIATLEHTQSRPAMFMHNPHQLQNVRGFLDGFGTACEKLGHSYSRETYEVAFTSHGWMRIENRAELLSQRSGKNMKDSGMSDAEIIQELFAIEIDCWKITRNALQPEQ